jgi:hypothetical protein
MAEMGWGDSRTYQDEVGNGARRLGSRIEAEVATVTGEGDAERHLARRRGGRNVHGIRCGESSVPLPRTFFFRVQSLATAQ